MHRRTFLAASIAALVIPATTAAAHNGLVQALLSGLSPASAGDARTADDLFDCQQCSLWC
ncbi:hypothetical protein [Streptomyces fulvoviolaceus]|uniref:hypothetical protein n=1 Tax=Streptomyces fulvoviolaceus TaxID=285535 RepID=UPI0004C9640D|nr:hypothetical protein [Streptomyces fulvoviolaceus]